MTKSLKEIYNRKGGKRMSTLFGALVGLVFFFGTLGILWWIMEKDDERNKF